MGTLNPETFEPGEFYRVKDFFLESGFFSACDILSLRWKENGGLRDPVDTVVVGLVGTLMAI